jgi:hypothetical protein
MHAKWDAEAEARIKARERAAIHAELEALAINAAKGYGGLIDYRCDLKRAGDKLIELEETK